MNEVRTREWGLQILDEVHQVVAAKFSRALLLHCHCRLGLTATLVREDGRDRNLSHLLGPKLYEANWMDLTRDGHLANVQVSRAAAPRDARARARELGRGDCAHFFFVALVPSAAWPD